MKYLGEIQAAAEQRGVKMPIIDSLIAATGLVHDLTVVTRNVTDMANSGVKLLNLWEEPFHSRGQHGNQT
jgi:predicted nucleic acid-binding protein